MVVLSVSAFAAAGTGLKVETQNFNEYVAAGFDLEMGLPGIPVHPVTELLGWWAMNDQQTSHVQAGLGARLYLDNAAKGPFVEAKLRYVLPLEPGASATSTLVFGAGYRIKPIVGGIDLFVTATAQDHALIPKYVFGARIGL